MREVSLIEKYMEWFMEKRRPPEEIRNEVDIGYRYENQVLDIFEIRPKLGQSA